MPEILPHSEQKFYRRSDLRACETDQMNITIDLRKYRTAAPRVQGAALKQTG
jgi:hypothetical protein